MPRLVRKVVLYVCTVDGSVHTTRQDAQAAARALKQKAAKKPARRGRPRLTQTDKILRAVHDGKRTALEIREAARVPSNHVHPILHRLKERKLVTGSSGTYALTAAGRRKLGA